MQRLLLPLSLAFFLLVLPAANGEVQPQDSTDAIPPCPTVDELPEIRELPNRFVLLYGTPV